MVWMIPWCPRGWARPRRSAPNAGTRPRAAGVPRNKAGFLLHLGLLCCVVAGGILLSFCSARAAEFGASVEEQVREIVLENGLTILVLERPFAPVFHYVGMVDAGASDEPSGRTGVAHLMEHMAFKGSVRVGTQDARAEAEALRRVDEAWEAVLAEKRADLLERGDSARAAAAWARFQEAQREADRYVIGNAFSKTLEENGVQGLNASTSCDATTYYYSLPSNKLELWALMEGNRMTWPVFREFYAEREVVIEERRMRLESSPRGRLRDETSSAAFVAHPYRNGVIGHRSDLEALSRADGEEFFREHYGAANMCMVLVGDVRRDEVEKLARKYLADIPRGSRNQPILTREPPPSAERMVRTREPAQPLCYVAYHGGPAFHDPRFDRVSALTDILSGGRSSRLYRALVKERRIATGVSCFNGMPGLKYDNLIWCSATPASGVAPDSLVEALQQEFEAIAQRPITPEELEGHRSRALADFVRGLRGDQGLASLLAFYQIRTGDWRNLFRWLDDLEALTPESITEEAARILRRSNRTVGILEEAGNARRSGS